MKTIIGRVYDIVKVNDIVSLVIIRQRHYDKMNFVALTCIGRWKRNIEELNLKAKDKFKGNIRYRSNEVKGRWFTDILMEECIRVDEPKKNNVKVVSNNLFKETEDGTIDLETGELF